MVSRPFWLIAEQRCGGLDVFTIGENVLPVFGFEEEAEMFFRLGVPQINGWRLGEITREELASVLCGPCRKVTHVSLDPVPGMVEFVSLGRERFMKILLGEFTPPPVEIVGVAS